MKENSRRLMWTVTGALLALSVLVIYATHREVPFMMDDLWYSTRLSDDTPIASLSDIVESQVWHYHNWGGRSMTHGILQLTLLAGEPAADLLNVVFTLLLAGAVCLVSGQRRLPAFFAALALPLGLNPNWRMSMFWQAGAANYLYITVFILGFLYCYLRELPEEKTEGEISGKSGKCGINFWIIPLGLLAGWSNENMGPAVWVMSLIVIVLGLREGRRAKPWMITGNIACLTGCVFCIAAPGNFVRSLQAEEAGYGRMWKLFLRCYRECRAALDYLFPTLLILGSLWLICRCVLGEKIGRRNALLLFGALLSWGALILSPHYPDRAAFGTMILCICAALSLAGKILIRRQDLAWPLWFGAGLVWLRGMYFCGEWLSVAWGWIK